MMWVSIEKLITLANPFEISPWNEIKNIELKDIEERIKQGNLIKHQEYNPLKPESYEKHIERIAWLVVNGWGDSYITINLNDDPNNWAVYDGCHRFLAAIYRNDEMIWASVYGSKENIRKLY